MHPPALVFAPPLSRRVSVNEKEEVPLSERKFYLHPYRVM